MNAIAHLMKKFVPAILLLGLLVFSDGAIRGGDQGFQVVAERMDDVQRLQKRIGVFEIHPFSPAVQVTVPVAEQRLHQLLHHARLHKERIKHQIVSPSLLIRRMLISQIISSPTSDDSDVS